MPYFTFAEKKVFYQVKGEGEPVLFLHGNTVSSKIFDNDAAFFSKKFTTILFDYPGCGESERIDEYPENYWAFNADCAIELLTLLGIKKVNLIAVSGGGLVALNIASKEPDLVSRIIIDRGLGEQFTQSEINNILENREKAKKTLFKEIWKGFHGEDWEKVIDADSIMLKRLIPDSSLIEGPISDINASVIFTGNLLDEDINVLIDKIKELSKKLKNSTTALYSSGNDGSDNYKFRQIALNFLNSSI
ncbi:MAG TPA: alpha/beta hydrolase [Ignavibacteriales bacterium]|nr:alpha/beta hydrolase [Ignavibacteriales bacterium]